MRKTRAEGFTLVELIVVLAVTAVLITVALVGAGRFFVENSDAVRAAQDHGLTRAHVTARHNFFAGSNGCASDDAVAFTVAGVDAHGLSADATVCCGTWFKGCVAR